MKEKIIHYASIAFAFFMFAIRLCYARFSCFLFGHTSALKADRPASQRIRFYSIIHNETREIDACKDCGKIYSYKIENDPVDQSDFKRTDCL